MTLNLAVLITGDASSLKRAAEDGKRSTDALGTSVEAVGTKAGGGAAGIARATTAVEELASAEREAAGASSAMGAALGAAGTKAGAAAADVVRATAAAEGLAKAQRDVAATAGAAATAVTGAQRAMGMAQQAQTAASGGRPAASPVAAQAAAAGLRPDQWKNLGFQANDIATSLFSGIPITQVIAQQGGQVTQVLGDAPGGIAGGLKIVAGRAMEVLTPVRLLTAGFIGAAAAVAYLGIKWARSQEEIRIGLMGIGVQSRATVGDINRIAESAAAGGKISRGDARGIAGAVAATGKVDVSNIPDIVNLAPGYAKLFGKDLTETGADLARIFADPVKGADELNARMGGLDAGTRTYIRTLIDQGSRQEAIRATVRAFAPEIDAAAEKTSLWAKAWGLVGTAAEATGRLVSKPFTTGTTKEQLAVAKADLAAAERASSSGLVIGGGPDLARDRARQNIAARKAEVDRLQAESDKDDAAPGKKASADLSREADAAVLALQPEIEQLAKLNNAIVLLQKTQNDLDAISGLSVGARKQFTDAIEAAKGGVSSFMTAQEQARASESLTIRSIEARTVAEKAAIAAERERLGLSGKAMDDADRLQRIEAARKATLTQSTRESQDKLRDATDANAAAGLLSYPRQRAELEARYRKIYLENQGNLPAIANSQKAHALDLDALNKEAVGGPLRDANRSLVEQVAALKLQQDAFGASTEAAARMAAAQQLVNQYNAAGIRITADVMRGIDAYASSAGKVAAASEDLVRKQREVVGGLDDIRSGSRSALTGIFSDVSQGKSPLAGITSSLNGVASKLFERGVATPLVNSTFGLDGKAGGGLFGDALSGIFGKAQGLSTADITAGVVNVNGTVSGIPGLGGTAPSAASVAAGAPAFVSQLSGQRAEVADYVRQAAIARGIDPNVALRVVNQESGFNTAAQNLTGREQSYGVMQLNTMGGLGAEALKAGVDVRNPDAWRSQIDYGMDTVKRDGWRQWSGARDIGVSRWEGVGQGGAAPSAASVAAPAVTGLDASLKSVETSATSAAHGVTGLTGDLGSLPATLTQTSQGVTQLSSSLGSNGGGLMGILSNIFGGGASATPAVTAATGGHIRGPGTGTSDSIVARLSDGEFVVNAAATRQNLPLLHAINDNRMPAFAEGGPVGTMRTAAAGGSSASDGGGLRVVINNTHSGADVSAREVPDARGGRQLVVQIDEMTAAAVGRPGSRTTAALARQKVYGR